MSELVSVRTANNGGFEPRIVAICCNWCTYLAAEGDRNGADFAQEAVLQ